LSTATATATISAADPTINRVSRRTAGRTARTAATAAKVNTCGTVAART
jgi:hypothetical protein